MDKATILISSGVSAAQLLSLRILLTSIIIILAGALIARGEGGGHQTTLARLNRQIFIPCLVFSALNRIPLHLSEAAMMCSGAALLSLCSYPLARWWVSRAPDKDSSGYLPMLFGSTSTLLLPLAYLLFGSQGLAKATFFHLANLLLLYTWGMRLTKQPTRITEFLKTPTLHAVLLALLLKLFELDLSGQVQDLLWLVEKGIAMMAAGALPMLLISHGYALFCLRSSGADWWSPMALIRMIWLPLVAWGLILSMRSTGMAPLDKGYDLMQYLDLRTSEAILLLASALPGTVSLFWMPTTITLPRRSASLILASSLLSVIALAVLLFMINRSIFSA